jgi:hypothetical protein
MRKIPEAVQKGLQTEAAAALAGMKAMTGSLFYLQKNLSVPRWKDFFIPKINIRTVSPGMQILYLFILALPVACISWTVTHERVFKEPRDFCIRQSRYNRSSAIRKFFYLFTCEYCFSHYVTMGMLAITEFTMLYSGWRGYLVSGFSMVWIANIYMSLFYRVRIDIKKEKLEVEEKEKEDHTIRRLKNQERRRPQAEEMQQ